jgi:hypothetical protein
VNPSLVRRSSVGPPLAFREVVIQATASSALTGASLAKKAEVNANRHRLCNRKYFLQE